MLDIFDIFKLRRSIRAFTGEEVSDEDIEKILEAARWAPSAGNIQPWEFIVIRKPETKREVAKAALNQTFIEEAPVAIIVCADEVRSSRVYGSRGATLYCIQDTAAAIENMLLAACALGLGACWVGAFYEEEVRRILNIPRGLRPVAIVPIGHPAEKPRPPYKRPLKEIVHYEKF
ncbi:MAG: nitroreductase family protein [Candidatus Bathyarchaeota archaeon]|nr:nitroreductase family protein [Candidatus Bathyarchaeota archaeon]